MTPTKVNDSFDAYDWQPTSLCVHQTERANKY